MSFPPDFRAERTLIPKKSRTQGQQRHQFAASSFHVQGVPAEVWRDSLARIYFPLHWNEFTMFEHLRSVRILCHNKFLPFAKLKNGSSTFPHALLITPVDEPKVKSTLTLMSFVWESFGASFSIRQCQQKYQCHDFSTEDSYKSTHSSMMH